MYTKFIVCSLLLLNQILSQLTTTQVVQIAEQKLDDLLAESKRLYSRRCTSQCDKKIFDECSRFAPELYCEQNFPYSSSCSVPGAFMNWDNSAGRCPVGANCNTQEDIEIQCSQAPLFDDDLDGNSLKHDLDSPIVYQYVGFSNGFRMIYPYQHLPFQNGYCQDYDPRYRPWYVGAATGAKNIVLIIDNSGSMDRENRLVSAKRAAVAVIETLGQQDWFAVIAFGQSAETEQSALIRAENDNKQRAINYINGLGYNGATNYELAFTKAFQLVADTQAQEFGSSCGETLFLFLTDGLPTAGEGQIDTTQDGYESTIPGQVEVFANWLTQKITDTGISPNIFTYALGSTAGEDFPKRMACDHNGIFYKISDANSRTQLLNDMRSYYDYLASGLDITQAIWSEIYLDQITNKRFVTAAKPIYVTNDQNVKILLGVAGVDIDVASIQNTPDYEDKIYEVQSRQRSQCSGSQVDLTACQLNSLRGDQTCPNEASCPSYEGGITRCAQSLNYDPWVQSYPTNSSGAQIQYTDIELSSCCPDPNAVIDNTQNSQIINISLILLVIGCLLI